MRHRVELGSGVPYVPEILREEPFFLFRRVADRDRAVLCIGSVSVRDTPRFDGTGKASDWWYGHVTYDHKEQLHGLRSPHAPETDLPSSEWHVPRWVIEWRAGHAVLHVRPDEDPHAVRELQERIAQPVRGHSGSMPGAWTSRTSRRQYLDQAAAFMQHIQRGDIYEVNYCIERQAHWPGLDPFAAFARLLERSAAPFAAFHRRGTQFTLCASPERFLTFQDERCWGEPMKGTRPRGRTPEEDLQLKAELAADPKERSENIMALDVMRNDLSQVALPWSVKVEELCAVRSYPRVHQLVSTVTMQRRPDIGPFDVVNAAFPMASMTGAPKHRAMQLIDVLEDQRRGLYSGTLGFFAPDGTGDLNVVIRAVRYDTTSGLARLSTGSALTAQCDPVKEWEECAVKARSVIEALSDDR